MATDTRAPRRRPSAVDVVQYLIIGFVAVSALAGAFTHMHDWTLREIDAALVDAGIAAHTPHWFGWANAVISELLPTSAFLSIRQRQRQGRSTTYPTWLFGGAFVVSIMAQLSATGIDVPFAAEFLATLPALAVLALSKLIFADVEHAAAERAAAELAAERAAELARRERAEAAELRRRQAAEAAELKVQREREAAEHAAELNARLAREAAELSARLERERIAAEGAAITRRAEIEAEERRQAREAEERRQAREAEIERAARIERERVAAAAEAERQRIEAEARADALRRQAEADAAMREAEAQRVAVEAEARRLAAERVAAARHEAQAGGDEAQGGAHRKRRSRQETAALVADVLVTLPAGTTRDAAVVAVAQALDMTERYAREFVSPDWDAASSAARPVEPAASSAGGAASSAASSAGSSAAEAASSAGRRHLAVVGSA